MSLLTAEIALWRRRALDAEAKMRQVEQQLALVREVLATAGWQAAMPLTTVDTIGQSAIGGSAPRTPIFDQPDAQHPLAADSLHAAPESPARALSLGPARLPREDGLTTLVIGPIGSISEIGDLVAALKEDMALDAALRLFRAGYYRVDAPCDVVHELIDWLKHRDDVEAVDAHGTTILITPRPTRR